MDMFQIHMRKREASCSHTETCFIQAPDIETAYDRALMLFGDHYAIKATLPEGSWLDQVACGCSESITWVDAR